MFRIFEKEVKGELKGWSIGISALKNVDHYAAEKAGVNSYGSINDPMLQPYITEEFRVSMTNFSDGDCTRNTEKDFPTMAEAEAFAEEKIAAKIKAKFPESEPGYPQMLQNDIQSVKNAQKPKYRFNTEYYGYAGVEKAFEELSQIESLTELEINGTYREIWGEAILKGFSKISSIETVRVELPSDMEEFPAEIAEMKGVKKLILKANNAKDIPEEIFSMSSLDELEISGYYLETLPDGFNKLVNLKKLALRCYQLTSLPLSISKIPNLESLQLEYTHAIPAEFFEMPKLKELDFSSASMSQFPSDILSLESLEKIKLPGQLNSIPSELFLLPNIREVNFESYRSSCTASLPKVIPTSSKLERLTLQGCGVTEIPGSLFLLPSLKHLNLTRNSIAEIPETILENSTIEKISLEHNPVGIDWDTCYDGIEAVKEWYKRDQQRKSGDYEGLVNVSLPEDSVPDEKERKRIKKEYDDRFKQFKKDVYGLSDELIDNIYSFIFGDIHEFSITGDIKPEKLVYRLDDLMVVFASVKDWTFVDERLLAIFTSGQIWYWEETNKRGKITTRGLHDKFLSWLNKELQEESDFDTFGRAAAVLSDKFEISKEVIVKYALNECGRHFFTKTGEVSSLGRFILEYASESTIQEMCSVVNRWVWSGDFARLILGGKPELRSVVQATLLPEKLTASDSGRICSPHRNLAGICEFFPEDFKEYTLMCLRETKCTGCLSNILDTAIKHYPEEEQAILDAIQRVFVEFSAAVNESSSSSLAFRGGTYDDGGEQKFIDMVLEKYGSKVYPFLETYISDTKLLKLPNIDLAFKYLGEEANPLIKEALGMGGSKSNLVTYYGQLFDIVDKYSIDIAFAREDLTEKFNTKDLEVAQVLAKQLAKLIDSDELMTKAQEYLKMKKKDERMRGVYLLENGDDSHREYLASILETEKNLDLREKLFSLFKNDQKELTKEKILERVAFAKDAGWLKKDVKKWLSVSDLPALYWSDGSEVDADCVHYMLYRQFRFGQMERDYEIISLYNHIDKSRSSEFALKLLNIALSNGGASAANRFALFIAGTLGGDEIVDEVKDLIYRAQNLNATTLLGIVATDKALLELRKVTKFYSTKYPNVREAAEEAILNASDSRGVPVGELFERIAPDFGFVNGFRELKSAEGAKVFITPEMKLGYIGTNGKARKSAPKEVSAAEKKELTALGKELKAVAKEYAADYESAMVEQRRWDIPVLLERFEANAMLNAIGQGIVWGVYVDGELEESYIFDSEGSLIDRMGEPIGDEYIKTGKLGIVHPLELDVEDLEEWCEYWEDEKLPKQPFLQLHRSVYRFQEITEPGKTMLSHFENKVVSPGTFKNRATKRLWRRGSVVDGGGVESYYRDFKSANISTFIMLEGMAVSVDWSDQVTLQELYFVDKGAVKVGSYVYDEPRNDRDSRLIPMDKLPELVFSEVISDMMFVTQ